MVVIYPLFLFFHFEEGFVCLWIYGVVVDGGVVGLEAEGGEHPVDFGSCPDDGTVAVGGVVVDGAVGVEGGVEG